MTDDRAVVELCSCSGEPMDVVEGDAPELIEFARARPDAGRPAPLRTRTLRASRPGRPHAMLRREPPPTPASSRARSVSDRRTRRAGPRAATTPAPSSRHGSRTPTPAQSARAAFSAMSPTCGTASTGQPQASARAIVPWPAWQTRARTRHLREYETQSTSAAFAGTRPADGNGRRFRSRARGPARRPAGQRCPQQPVRRILGGRGRHQHQRVPRPAAARPRDGGSQSAARPRARRPATSAGTRAAGTCRHAQRSLIPPCSRDTGGRPKRDRAASSGPLRPSDEPGFQRPLQRPP